MKRFIQITISVVITALVVAGTVWAVQNFYDDTFDSTYSRAWNVDLQRMEDSLLTLKSSHSGTSAPANAVEGMFWADSDDNVLRFYTSPTTYVDMFDWDTMRWNFGAGTIVAADISNSARKPSLVSGQVISPTSVGNASTTELEAVCDGAVGAHKVVVATDVSSASYYDFSSLSGGYNLAGTFSISAAPVGYPYIRINSDSGSNYDLELHYRYYNSGQVSGTEQRDNQTLFAFERSGVDCHWVQLNLDLVPSPIYSDRTIITGTVNIRTGTWHEIYDVVGRHFGSSQMNSIRLAISGATMTGRIYLTKKP